MGDWLITQQSDQEVEIAVLGLPFPLESPRVYVPLGKPNLITTVYVSQALFALGEATGNQQYTNLALNSADFMVSILYNDTVNQEFFSYIPGESA